MRKLIVKTRHDCDFAGASIQFFSCVQKTSGHYLVLSEFLHHSQNHSGNLSIFCLSFDLTSRFRRHDKCQIPLSGFSGPSIWTLHESSAGYVVISVFFCVPIIFVMLCVSIFSSGSPVLHFMSSIRSCNSSSWLGVLSLSSSNEMLLSRSCLSCVLSSSQESSLISWFLMSFLSKSFLFFFFVFLLKRNIMRVRSILVQSKQKCDHLSQVCDFTSWWSISTCNSSISISFGQNSRVICVNFESLRLCTILISKTQIGFAVSFFVVQFVPIAISKSSFSKSVSTKIRWSALNISEVKRITDRIDYERAPDCIMLRWFECLLEVVRRHPHVTFPLSAILGNKSVRH